MPNFILYIWGFCEYLNTTVFSLCFKDEALRREWKEDKSVFVPHSLPSL